MPTFSQRQVEILEAAKERGFVTIESLAEQMQVTTQTIRRDINYLCEENALSRFHGGAAYRSSVSNVPYEARRGSLAKEKSIIAQAVVREIVDDSSVFIDIGTTAEAVAMQLRQRRGLRVVTNNLNVVNILASKEDFELIVVAGQVRLRDLAIVGETSGEFINRFRVDYSVLGVVAIAEDGSILDFSIDDTSVTQASITCAAQSFVVADHSKFGRRAVAKVAHLSQVSALFTDALPKGPWRNMLAELGTRVIEG